MRIIPVIGLVFVFALSVGPVSADLELDLGNPGFERLAPDGTVIDWVRDTAGSSDGATVAASAEIAHSGVGSLSFALRGRGSVTAESAPVELEVGPEGVGEGVTESRAFRGRGGA